MAYAECSVVLHATLHRASINRFLSAGYPSVLCVAWRRITSNVLLAKEAKGDAKVINGDGVWLAAGLLVQDSYLLTKASSVGCLILILGAWGFGRKPCHQSRVETPYYYPGWLSSDWTHCHSGAQLRVGVVSSWIEGPIVGPSLLCDSRRCAFPSSCGSPRYVDVRWASNDLSELMRYDFFPVLPTVPFPNII